VGLQPALPNDHQERNEHRGQILLLILPPGLAAIAVATKLTSKGSVNFKQRNGLVSSGMVFNF
jgi:hypothetical protein